MTTRRPPPASSRPVSTRGGGRVECRIENDFDVYAVQRAAKKLAARRGFGKDECVEIAIAASELTSNVRKYGVSGLLILEAVDDPARGPGIRVTARDRGPPFHDFEMAVRDGCDETGPLDPASLPHRSGIGKGLGAVRRFSDALGWHPCAEGKEVWFVRYRLRG
jgi:anti-sigma regulatory factor (Ser/Thr protein kinase)